jgi:hypothetical protein
MSTHRLFWVILLMAMASDSYASLGRDAGKAKSLEEPAFVMEAALQHEREGDVRSNELELAVQFVPESIPRLSLLAESVVGIWRNDDGHKISGTGDTDLSLSYLLLAAGRIRPAIVAAFKVKLPTAAKDEFGTGEVDYSAILVIGNEFEDLELNLELEISAVAEPEALPGPSIIGSNSFDQFTDLFTLTLAADYGITDYLSCFAEFIHESEVQDTANNSKLIELGIEADMDISEDVNLFLELGIDSDGLFSPKIGCEIGW